MQRLLLHPPFADPTQPYLSLPTLKGWLRARGLDATVVDLNVEAAHWLFEPETLAARALMKSCGLASSSASLHAIASGPENKAAWVAIPAATSRPRYLLTELTNRS